MAEFKRAYTITVLGNEGGLNPGNNEAFTYRGIDESQHPNWIGFKRVHEVWNQCKPDIAKANKMLNADSELQSKVETFYLYSFWNNIQLGSINNQAVANILFDDSVNPCEISVAKVMQMACNMCHCLPPVTLDGAIGNRTIAAINSIEPETYYNAIKTIRTFHYNHEVVDHPKQRVWLKNWLSRLKDFKDAA